ncbi:MAG TPA: hypothetical protein VI864_00380 [Candidatus Bathyarchaeia archaeon]|nr:hypothetical protein [Candidatus Bathyarchaeia archaeon]
MYELKFITDLVEEQVIKGHLRWLANFSEIHKDYPVEDITFPIYASGGLQEKGFFLSRIYSTLVTPKYKVHLLLYTLPEINPTFLRKIILALKRKFGTDDWIFVALVQGQPMGKALKESVESIDDKTVGIAAYGVGAKETVTSNNVLGRGLAKQLKLNEAKYENFDVPNYLKSFTATFALGVFFLVFLTLSGVRQLASQLPIALIILFILSLIIGQVIYKSRYHMSVSIDSKGFQLREGKKIKEGKWTDYSGLSIFLSPNRETFLRLKSKDATLDLPLSRTGLPRRETYSMVKQLMKKK